MSLFGIMRCVDMLNVDDAECHYAGRHYTNCHNAVSHYAECHYSVALP